MVGQKVNEDRRKNKWSPATALKSEKHGTTTTMILKPTTTTMKENNWGKKENVTE
jgi:hypothetical protein